MFKFAKLRLKKKIEYYFKFDININYPINVHSNFEFYFSYIRIQKTTLIKNNQAKIVQIQVLNSKINYLPYLNLLCTMKTGLKKRTGYFINFD